MPTSLKSIPSATSDDSDADEFSDTLDHLSESDKTLEEVITASGEAKLAPSSQRGRGNISSSRAQVNAQQEVNQEIGLAVSKLRQSIEQAVVRIDSVEKQLNQAITTQSKNEKRWWPFSELSATTTSILVIWPFVAHLIVAVIRERRRH
ncbi:hypothetical protein HDE_13669 [Halotydeus destructor]|nr:hypothetical protein HDE_13669 [Halotydeus destructor]